MSGWFGGGSPKEKKTHDEKLKEKGEGPYTLPPEENDNPHSSYVENCGRKYRVATLQDFIRFRDQALSDEGWTERHKEPKITVFDRVVKPGTLGAGLNMIKVVNTFLDVVPAHLYDSLHSPDFRKTWDESMQEGFNVCQLDPRNDVGTYVAAMPWPLHAREFINMRSWMEFTNGDFIIFNRSVIHADYPVTAKFVRGLSYIGGYYISPLNGDKNKPGTRMIFLTHGNMEGNIPASLINMAYSKLSPSMMSKLETNSARFVEWSKEQGRDASYIPPWRTAAVDWDASKNAAGAAAALKLVSDAVSSTTGAGEGAAPPTAPIQVVYRMPIGDLAGPTEGCTGCDNVKTLEELAKGCVVDAAVQAQVEEAKAKLRAVDAQALLGGAEADPVSVEQLKGIIDHALQFVDRQYTFEGRAPASVAEYLLRLLSVVAGIQRSIAP